MPNTPQVFRLNPELSGLGHALDYRNKLEFSEWDQEPQISKEASAQQGELVGPMLQVLNGGETALIRFSAQFDPVIITDRLHGPEYKISGQIQRGNWDVVNRLCNVASAAYVVHSFADQFGELEYGNVNQALCGAFRVLYGLYLDVVNSIETSPNKLTLYQMWIELEGFAAHLFNAKNLILRFIEKAKQARERKRLEVTNDLIQRASTSQFVSHDDCEATLVLRGSAVLREIAEIMRREMGDPVALNLYDELLTAASRPYLQMLQLWVTRGVLNDPFEEFVVQETMAHSQDAFFHKTLDDYWDKRYSVRVIDLPLQLSNSHTQKMLTLSGKYINVIREIGDKNLDKFKEVSVSFEKCTNIEDSHVIEAIGLAYKYANEMLISLLNDSSRLTFASLLAELSSIYFLKNKDFFDRFFSLAGKELSLPASQTSLTVLENCLEQVKDIDNPWSSFLTVSLEEYSLKDYLLNVVSTEENTNSSDKSDGINRGDSKNKLLGWEVFIFNFRVPPPLSLVINRRSILRYQFLFRHLVELTYLQSCLRESWVSQVRDPPYAEGVKVSSGYITNETGDHNLNLPLDHRYWRQRSGNLRQRQIQLVNLLLYHSTVDGIEPEMAQFEQSLKNFTEISEIEEAHLRFLDRSLMSCLLSDPQILKLQARLLSLSRQFVKFEDQNKQSVHYFCDQRAPAMLDPEGVELSRDQVLAWYASIVEKHEQAFERNMQRFCHHLKAYVPNNYVASSSTLFLLQQLERLQTSKYTPI